MHPKAPIYGVVLLVTLVSCTVYIDDQDASPSLLWGGSWERYTDLGSAYTELAWQGTLSLGNQSGATVTFTFTGTSVGVFGSLWPGETGARSTYAIDNGKPTEFVPSGLQEPARLQFYASGALPEGEHTLKVTNLGSFLWLDYFEYDDVVPSSTVGSGVTTTATPKATTAQPSSTTTTTTVRPSPVTITTTASPSHDVGGPLSSTTSQPSASSSSQASAPGTSSTVSTSSSSSAAATPPPLYPIPSSPSATSPSSGASGASSSTAPPPPQDPAASQPRHRLSHGALVGLIAATTAGGVALLTLLLLYLARRRRAARSRLRDAALPSFQKPAPSEDGDPHSSPNDNGDASLCSTSPSPTTTTTTTPVVRVMRPAPEAGDHVIRSACDSCGPTVGPRAIDGGVSVAGGRGFSNGGDAPSIAEVEGSDEKNMLPPSYQDCTGTGP